jgi:hypothetical protein
MKLKKFFAGVLAAAMMLTVGATAAFADVGATTPVTNDGNGTFTITKKYAAENENTFAPAETFKLEQTAKSGKQMSVSYNGVVPDLKTVAGESDGIVGVVSFTTESGDDQTGNFTIGLPKYDGVGVFTYTLKEVDATNAGIKNDGRTFTVTVYATQGDDGIETGVTVHEGTSKGTKVTSIDNKFQAGALTIHKDVKGSMGDKAYEFPFTVTLSSAKPVTAALRVNGETSTVKFEKASEAATEYTATFTFNLSNGKDYTIGNIPYNVTYTVSENGETNGELTVGSGDNAVKYDVEYSNNNGTKVEGATATVTVTNTAGDVVIDTGVILDNAPYIALLAIVAIGGVALMLNKRRRDEE